MYQLLILFYCRVVFCGVGAQFVEPLAAEGCLDCFQFGAVRNETAINICVQGSVCT